LRYLVSIFLLLLLYCLLPKLIRLDIKIEKRFLLRIYYKIWIFNLKIFSYSFPSRKKHEKKQIGIEVSGQKKLKLNFKVILDTVLKGLKLLFDVSEFNIRWVKIRLFYNDAAILAMLSGIIYSIRGILISCEKDSEIYYEGYLRDSRNDDNFFEFKIEIKIFPLRILFKISKIINIIRGVLKYGTSN